MSYLSYLRRIMSGGPQLFWRRLVGSRFGLATVKRELTYARRKRDILARQKQEPGDSIVQNRSELQALLGVPALINDPEIAIFEKYAPRAERTIVEIGCAYGGSSLLLLMHKRPTARVVSIDPFIKDSMGEFQATEELCRDHVTHALRDLGLSDRVAQWQLVPDYSYNHIRTWQQSIDVLFIDGDHRYEAVKQDFEQWVPFVSKGGVIFFHDSRRPIDEPGAHYKFGWPGPSQLIRELRQDERVREIDSAYSITVFEKSHD